MAVTTDIAATYRGPAAVLRAKHAAGVREDRALAWLMGACLVMFVAQWPRIAREAHLEEREIGPFLGGALLATLFFLPLVFYGLAMLSQLIMLALHRPVSGFEARLALFWSLLAGSPLLLLNGLVAGFIGPGGALTLVGAAWFGVVMWFWITGLRIVSEDKL